MANSSRSNMIRLLAFTVLALVLAATSKAVKTYGLDSGGQIEGIRYTWNAEVPGSVKPFDGGSGTIKVSRTWEWDPMTGTVSYEGKDNNGQPLKVTYQGVCELKPRKVNLCQNPVVGRFDSRRWWTVSMLISSTS
jgi:hypothetical protein